MSKESSIGRDVCLRLCTDAVSFDVIERFVLFVLIIIFFCIMYFSLAFFDWW